MDTEKIFYTNEEIEYDELEEGEKQTVSDYVEATRHLQEIHSFFGMYMYNLDLFTARYTLMANGDVYEGERLCYTEDDFVAINAYTVSILSSMVTFVENMKTYAKSFFGKDGEAFIEFENTRCDMHKKSFAYRVGYALRNYSQHGHVPVSQLGNNYRLDLYQIVNKPHMDNKSKIYAEMRKIIDEVLEIYNDNATFSLTMILAECVKNVLGLYMEFLRIIYPHFKKVSEDTEKIIKKYPKNLKKNDEFFIYGVIGEFPQGVENIASKKKLYNNIKTEARKKYKYFTKEFKDITDKAIFVKTDGEKIEIRIGLPK